jgi:hypothetical protein
MIGIDGYRCIMFEPSKKVIFSCRFDLQNPCSWCKNRLHIGEEGPAFFYSEYGHWEFPFIAEPNCSNFTLLTRPGVKFFNQNDIKFANEVQKNRNKIAAIGAKYGFQWSAYIEQDISRFMDIQFEEGKLYLPKGLTTSKFYREIGNLKSDFFEMRLELRDNIRSLKSSNQFRDDRLEKWMERTENMLKNCMIQTEELEDIKEKNNFSIFSNWGIKTLAGGVAYDSIKTMGRIIGEILGKTF